MRIATEQHIQEGYERRMANLRSWRYGEDGEHICPCCFGTWIRVAYIAGHERLECCECEAQGPLPERYLAHMRVKIIALALISLLEPPKPVEQQVRIAHSPRRTPRAWPRDASFTVAW